MNMLTMSQESRAYDAWQKGFVYCVLCCAPINVKIDGNQFIRISKNEELIQDICPELSADEREMLITGICPKCWDEEVFRHA